MTFHRTIRCLRLLSIAAVIGCATANADLIRIMPVGDSITVGYTNLEGQPYVPYQYGYRAGLYSRLNDAGYSFQFVGQSTEHPTASGASVDLAALGQDGHNGYGGQGTAFVADRIANWIRTDNPDVILLMIGINDIGLGSTGHPEAAESRLASIVEAAIHTKPEAHLIVAQTIPYSTYTDSIVQYNHYIKDTLVPLYRSQGKNVSTVDQYSNLLTEGVIDPALYSNAINHPSLTAYDRMAQTWYEGIQSLGTITSTTLPEIPAVTDPNLFTGKPVVASSIYSASFDPAYATDGAASDHVFSGLADGGGDDRMRLVVHEVGGGFRRIRLWRNTEDECRIPSRVLIKSTASDTVSLDPDGFETTLADCDSLAFNSDGYVDIDVDAPDGTQSVLFDFGGVDSLGQPYGVRIEEIQAFAVPEPSSMAVGACALAVLLGCGVRRRTLNRNPMDGPKTNVGRPTDGRRANRSVGPCITRHY